MPRIGITFKEVFQAAEAMVVQGQTPTQDNIREYLGRGSRGTIHKYLKQWKEACFKKSTINTKAVNPMDYQAALKERRDLKQMIGKQIEQNENLSAQLVEAELENAQNREKSQGLEAELRNLKEQILGMDADHKALQQAFQIMEAERNGAIKLVLDDKNQQIESLKEELKELNQVSLAHLRESGY